MSVRNLISETQPIPINYTKSCYSFSDPATPKKNYLFSLELCLEDGTLQKFNKIENNKYSYIVDIDDNIVYNSTGIGRKQIVQFKQQNIPAKIQLIVQKLLHNFYKNDD